MLLLVTWMVSGRGSGVRWNTTPSASTQSHSPSRLRWNETSRSVTATAIVSGARRDTSTSRTGANALTRSLTAVTSWRSSGTPISTA